MHESRRQLEAGQQFLAISAPVFLYQKSDVLDIVLQGCPSVHIKAVGPSLTLRRSGLRANAFTIQADL